MGHTILIVEDEVSLLQAMSRRLERRGFCVLGAENAEQALAHIQNTPLDLVISDVRLGSGSSGIEVFEKARLASKTPPFIFLTAHAVGTPEMERCLGLGAEAVFPKPMEFQHLLAKICEILGLQGDQVAFLTQKG